MNEQSFIQKWKNDLPDSWTNNACEVYWARSYQLDNLNEITKDYLAFPKENRTPCCLNLATNIMLDIIFK